jgi:hypothetical protein
MQLIKSRRIKWAELPTNMGTRESGQQKHFSLKPSRVETRLGREWEDNIKMDLKEIKYSVH